MKKLLAIVLSIAMLACFAVVASAENEDVTVTVSSANIDADGNVTLDISGAVAEGKNVGSFQFILKYDAEKLTPVSQKKNSDDPSNAVALNKKPIPGTDDEYILPEDIMLTANLTDEGFRVAFITSDGLVNPGVWATVKFHVTDKAAAGEEIEVTLGNVDASMSLPDGGTAPLTVAVTAGKVINAVPTPEPPVSSGSESKGEGPSKTESKGEESKTESKTDDGKKPVPKTGDNSVVFFAVALCVAAAAAFVVTKKVND